MRQCLWLRKYGIKPWEMDQVPVEVARWLDAVDYTIRSIENGPG
jgi:hypothetical protein